jgi:hypothetical protein
VSETGIRHGDEVDRTGEWDRMRAEHLRPRDERPASSAQGVHHVENRDYRGSTHFFFDIGHGNALAFFDFPRLGLADYAEVLGGLHHLAISMERDRWEHVKAKLDDAGVEYAHVDGSSLYFRGPDGERIELIADPLGEMYGRELG